MSVDESAKKFRDGSTIQVINKCIGLKDSDTKRNNDILKQVLKNVLDIMKTHDEFFRDNFQNLVFVGSYYKGTKVGKPEEFDVNLIIKLPVKYESIQLEKGMPGFAKLNIKNTALDSPKWEKHSKILSKWIDQNGYLNQDAFRKSMESLFTRAESKFSKNDKYTVKVRKSGPAFTLWITEPGSLTMAVDLVPVLEFNKPPPLPGNFSGVPWYAVPKPFKISGEDTHLNWRIALYNYEKNMLLKYGHLKPVIRQVKKLRDTEDWKIIPSYQIETLFMHFVKEAENNSDLERLAGTKLFIHMLTRLKEACENQRIMNFWDNTHNMLDADKTQLASIVGRLARIIKQINLDPLTMADCVLTKDELSEYEDELKGIRNSRSSVKTQPIGEQPIGPQFNTHTLASIVNNLSKMTMATTADSENNDSSSFGSSTNSNNAESMHMLRLIRSDIGELRNSVDQLSQRMDVVERRVGSSSSRNPNTQDQGTAEVITAAQSLFNYMWPDANSAN